jgi:hypothetical protein
MKINVVKEHKPREYSLWSHSGGTVLCEKENGAFLVLRFTEDLVNLKKLLNEIEIVKVEQQ